MVTQLDRLTAFINSLLDVSRLETGRVTLEIGAYNMRDLLKECADQVKQSYASHQIKISGSKQITITADINRLRQVFINLLSNAVKYSPEAETVEVRMQEDEHTISVDIQDFGVGVPGRMKQKIFQRYRRAHEEKSTYAGLGLGLYISMQIVRLHKGSLRVTSGNKGSTFTVALPKTKEIYCE